jgi:hypothetical protein
MTHNTPTAHAYEIDRLSESQPIVVRHIEDQSSGLPLFIGLASYVALLPVLFTAMMIASYI